MRRGSPHGPTAAALAPVQTASVIGRELARALLQRVCAVQDEL